MKKVARDVATFSPVVTLEPRRRRFHQPVTLTMPLPPPLATAETAAAEPFSEDVDPDNLRLLCSLTGRMPLLFGFLRLAVLFIQSTSVDDSQMKVTHSPSATT